MQTFRLSVNDLTDGSQTFYIEAFSQDSDEYVTIYELDTCDEAIRIINALNRAIPQ